MSWYAVAALDDALDATKALLLPFDARQWLRLALVVFFVGSAGSGGPTVTAGSSTGDTSAVPPGFSGPSGLFGPGEALWNEQTLPVTFAEALPFVVAALAVALLFGLLYALVGSVMEFVFVESLRRQRVRIRSYADQHLGQALGLFGFRLALGLVVALPAVAVALAAVSFADGQPNVSVGLLVVSVPLLVLLGIAVAVVDAFTTNFVVPVMILKNVGVVAGWRRFWPTLAAEREQYGVYALVWVALVFAVGALASVLGGVVGAVLTAPVAVVALLAMPVFGSLGAILSNPVALAVAVVLLLGYVVLMAVMAVLFVPVQTYLGYHALLVLGDTDAEFDLIPDLRREIREKQ
jgi:hypothetical protein